jgi:glutamine synthetase
MENREAAIRLIPTAVDQSAAHLEIKAVDPTANPYLLLGALQAQVLDALRHQRSLPAEQTGDPALVSDHNIARLPASLVEARMALEQDVVLHEAMGPLMHGSFLDSLAAEIHRMEHFSAEQQVGERCWWPIVGGIV